MEKLIHNILFSVFIKPEEDYENIFDGFIQLLGELGLNENDDIELREEESIGFNDKKIKIISTKIHKERYVKIWIKYLLSNLTKKQKEMLISQKESRLDEDLFFFIRLDKQKFLLNEWDITDGGDCYHIKLHIAAYPAKKEKAMTIIDKIFKE